MPGPSSQGDPIAVCGLSLKFPQDGASEKGFWSMLLEKRGAMTEYPPDRVNVDAFYHPTQYNALRTRGGHFLKESLANFDASFFSLTRSEASAMNPMQRMMLETTYRAFENAGLRMEDVKGSRSSVHTGCFTSDYLQQMLKDSERLPPYAAVGATQSMLANRLSWFYDLRGPSVNLDSACSSSAMAVDLSCQLLSSGITDMGIVAGCNLLLDPDFSTILSNMQMLSPDGLCYAFDHRANGYSRGEGIGVVILKRLSDALRNNDTIRAVIRAVGTNQDGRTPGITQPDPKMQAQLISETYERAGLSMEHTRFFEAHGTGTAIGDPIELRAITECFHQHRNASDPLYVGSVKTNIGHLEGASGIAGLIKAVLVVESGVIPPNANFESINRKLAAYDYMVSFPSECISWPPCEIRRASINSFGYGGTNSHIVIDDAFSYLQRRGLEANFSIASRPHHRGGKILQPANLDELPKLLVWSGSTDRATRELVVAWESYCSKTLESMFMPAVSDIAYTLDTRRSSLPSKSFAVISEAADLQGLTQIASAPVSVGKQKPRLAFIFTGQGAQWYAMGRELFSYPVFADSIRSSETILARLGCRWSVEAELKKGEKESLVDRPDVAQCLTAVLQIAMTDLMKSFDINPVAVVGHSMGEIAAAYCAGLLTQDSALRIAFYRGFFTAQLPERSHFKGAMLAVALPLGELHTYFDRIRPGCHDPSALVVSCVNSPVNTTVSGEESAIESLKQMMDAEGIFSRRLRVPVAYHSPQMELIENECLRSFDTLESPKQDTEVKMVSSVTGAILTKEMVCEASYWTKNMVSPVLFSGALGRLLHDSIRSLTPKIDGSHQDAIVVNTLVEVGPHAALQIPIQEITKTSPKGREILYFSTLFRRQSAFVTLLRLMGQLYCQGLPVNLRRVNDRSISMQGSPISLIDAPEYPFDHSKAYWAESPLVRNYRLRAHGPEELLGSPARDWTPLLPQWRCYVQVQDIPWLMDHRLSGKSVYPASAMIVMAIQGAIQLTGTQAFTGVTLRNVRYDSAIAVAPDETNLETRLQLKPLNAASSMQTRHWSFSVHSVLKGHWAENCSGSLELQLGLESNAEGLEERSRFYEHCLASRTELCRERFDSKTVYDNFTKSGFHYGSSFQCINTSCHDGSDTVTASLSWGNPSRGSLNPHSFIIHPAHLDSFFHLALLSTNGKGKNIPTQAISHINKLWISADGLNDPHVSLCASARLEHETPRTKLYSGFAVDEDKRCTRLALDGLETTVIASLEKAQEHAVQDQFWCNIQTRVDVEMLSGTEILQHLDSICGPDAIGPRDFLLDLRHYLYSAMKDIRSSIEKSGTDPTNTLFRKYVDWMDWHLNVAHENQFLANSNELRRRISEQGVLGNLFLKVADNALHILQGECDIVQLMFEDDLMENFYEKLFAHSLYYLKLQAYLEDLSFKNPSMDFLEVGAGTGSFTQRILTAVSAPTTGAKERFNSYFYTDISPAFFERARDRFLDQSHKMKFGSLDLEQDLLAQGFKEKSFDVIAASNVLHVTKNLDVTLQKLRKLLKPGGKLLIHEYTRPECIEVGFVFGLFSGWWPDDEERHRSPLASEETWDALLRGSGFAGADFTLRDFSDQDSHLMSIICATAPEAQQANPVVPDVVIAVERGSRPQEDFADVLVLKLSAEGCHATRIELSSPREEVPPHAIIVTLFDLEVPLLSRLDEKRFELLKSFLLHAPTVLWVSNGGPSADPRHGLISGFARVFRMENIQSKFATLALDEASPSSVEDCRIITTALRRMSDSAGSKDPEDYIVKNGALCLSRIYENSAFRATMSEKLSGARHVTMKAQDAKPFQVSFQGVDSLHPPRITKVDQDHSSLHDEQIEIDVRSFGLNLIDFAMFYGKLNTLNLGRECAGVVTKVGRGISDLRVGDHVCAYGTNIIYSTSRIRRDCVIKVPQSMPFETAATLPQDYAVANYIAQEIGVRRDAIILVKGGDTRLGRATLNTLRQYSSRICTTFTTTETGDNTFFEGIKIFPEIFLAESLKSSFGEGARVVLDLVNTDVLQLVDCVAKFGSILKVKVIGASSWSIGNFELPSTVSFKAIDVVDILENLQEELTMPCLELNIASMSSQLPVKTVDVSCPLNEMVVSERNFKTEERIAVTYDDESKIEVSAASRTSDGEKGKEKPMLNKSKVYEESIDRRLFNQSCSYVISGGFGDLGCCLAKWMAARGARYLILLSRSGPCSELAKTTIQDLQQLGVQVRAPLCDVSDTSSLQGALHQIQDMPEIKGCIQAAGVINDVMYERMSFKEWQGVVKPKSGGSWNLHVLLPKAMDFFILTSSFSGIVGRGTQINYAAGNTYQDALAEHRLSVGEKAVSLDLGVLATGGLVSQNERLAERIAAENFYTVLSEPEILALFGHFCDPGLPIDEIPSQVVSGFVKPSSRDRQATDLSPAFSHPFWSHTLKHRGETNNLETERNKITSDLNHRMAEATSAFAMSEMVATALADQMSSLAMTSKSNINMEEPLHVAGADSLSALYLRNWIMKQFAVEVAVFDILGDMSIVALGNLITRQWRASRGIQ
uniref:Carrier domain-containing protein n=1 Tax=Pestalotiopsis sp. TaxID=36460 RepID=A0A8U0AWP7_PESTX|nr:hypothetical protein [Pestalotiopsis sp.]